MQSVGFGTCDVTSENIILQALDSGYRIIDTASHYYNEEIVGEAIKNSDIPRDEIKVISKLWYSDMGYENTIAACMESLKKLGMDYIDLYLIHWPAAAPKYPNWEQVNLDTWKAMEYLYNRGFVKAIGTCNFMIKHMESLIRECEIIPMYNQIENHIGFYQKDVKEYCDNYDIKCIAWQPLGGSEILNNNTIKKMSKKYGKSEAQICIRWNLQHGFIPIPKTSSEKRMRENLDVFDLIISEEDIIELDAVLQCGGQCAQVK